MLHLWYLWLIASNSLKTRSRKLTVQSGSVLQAQPSWNVFLCHAWSVVSLFLTVQEDWNCPDALVAHIHHHKTVLESFYFAFSLLKRSLLDKRSVHICVGIWSWEQICLRVNLTWFLNLQFRRPSRAVITEGGLNIWGAAAARQINSAAGKRPEKELNRAVFSGIWTRTIDERSMMEWMNVNSFIKNWRLWHNKNCSTGGYIIMSWGCEQMQTSAAERNAIKDKLCQCECQHSCYCQNGLEDLFPPPPSWLPSPWRQLNRVAHFAISSTTLESNILQRAVTSSAMYFVLNLFCRRRLQAGSLQLPDHLW